MSQRNFTDNDDRTSAAADAAAPVVGRPRRAFAGVYCASLVATYLAVILLNWLGNGSGCFMSPLCPSVTDRAWKTRQLERIVRDEGPPQVLILGSSRLMQMKPAQVRAITGKRCFNYCLIGSNILDYVAQLRYALAIGAKPETVILDLRRFDGGVGEFNSQLASHPGLLRAAPFPESVQIVAKALQAVNLKFTAASARNLVQVALRGRIRQDAAFLEEGEVVILRDGYRLNRVRTAAKAAGKSDLAAELAVSAGGQAVGSESGGNNLPCNPWWRTHCREFLSLARSSGIRVYVVVTPLLPRYEAALTGKDQQYLHAYLPGVLKAECDRLDAEFRDFSRIESFAGDPDEFWDIVHQTPVNMQRMTNALFGVAPNKTYAGVATDLELLQELAKDRHTDARKQPPTEGESL